jgi:hypothetical protein
MVKTNEGDEGGGGVQGCLFPPHVFIVVVDAINDVIKAMINVGHIQCISLSDSSAHQVAFPICG